MSFSQFLTGKTALAVHRGSIVVCMDSVLAAVLFVFFLFFFIDFFLGKEACIGHKVYSGFFNRWSCCLHEWFRNSYRVRAQLSTVRVGIWGSSWFVWVASVIHPRQSINGLRFQVARSFKDLFFIVET